MTRIWRRWASSARSSTRAKGQCAPLAHRRAGWVTTSASWRPRRDWGNTPSRCCANAALMPAHWRPCWPVAQRCRWPPMPGCQHERAGIDRELAPRLLTRQDTASSHQQLRAFCQIAFHAVARSGDRHGKRLPVDGEKCGHGPDVTDVLASRQEITPPLRRLGKMSSTSAS